MMEKLEFFLKLLENIDCALKLSDIIDYIDTDDVKCMIDYKTGISRIPLGEIISDTDGNTYQHIGNDNFLEVEITN